MVILPQMLRSEAETNYNCKYKVYPDGSMSITAADRAIYRMTGWEARERTNLAHVSQVSDEMILEWREAYLERPGEDLDPIPKPDPSESLDRSRRRAAAALRDYALCNDFRWFVTLTLDGSKIDRYDYQAIMRKVRVWLDNQVRRHGLRYILVPEFHKDGAIHFHGLFPGGCSGAMDMTYSGTVSIPGRKAPVRDTSKAGRAAIAGGYAQKVYNIPGWKWGYSTAIRLYGLRRAAINYVAKYISKGAQKVGGRWYFHGGRLERPEIYYGNINFAEVAQQGQVYTVPDAKLTLAYQYQDMSQFRVTTICDGCDRGNCSGCKEEIIRR